MLDSNFDLVLCNCHNYYNIEKLYECIQASKPNVRACGLNLAFGHFQPKKTFCYFRGPTIMSTDHCIASDDINF